jgi:hypothetical protein
MSVLHHIAGFLSFWTRAAALSQKIEDGTLSAAERHAALSALLLSDAPPAPPAVHSVAAKTAAA